MTGFSLLYSNEKEVLAVFLYNLCTIKNYIIMCFRNGGLPLMLCSSHLHPSMKMDASGELLIICSVSQSQVFLFFSSFHYYVWWENRYPFPGDNSGVVERTNKSAGTYAKACLAVASECKIPAIDLWTKMQNIPRWQKACLRYSHSLHFFSFQFMNS